MFDRDRGELSKNMVVEDYGLPHTAIDFWIRVGKLKTVRKGHYHVIMKPELERFLAEDLQHYDMAVENG